MLLKTLDKAVADGNRIYGVVRSLGVSSDGRGRSLWAPLVEGQVEAVMRAYRDPEAGRRLQYVEAHATSTKVGDATELTALGQVLKRVLPSGVKIPIGSVKLNVGHTLETAGMAGLVKVLLSLEHGMIPPACHTDKLNEQIDWDEAPFFVPRSALAWPRHQDGLPRRAAVNSFGIGGLNVHLLIDEFTEADAKRTASSVPAMPIPRDPDGEAVAIIGQGCILPGAYTIEAFWDLLVTGRDPKGPPPPERWSAELLCDPTERRPYRAINSLGGYVRDYEFDWRLHKVPPKQVQNANPLQFMLLDATDQALRDAGYDKKQYDHSRVAVVVGTEFGGDFANRLQMGLRLPEFVQTFGQIARENGVDESHIEEVSRQFTDLLLKRMPALLDETGSFTSSTLASRITKTFDLMEAPWRSTPAPRRRSALWPRPWTSCSRTRNPAWSFVPPVSAVWSCFPTRDCPSRDCFRRAAPCAGFDGQVSGFVPGEGVGVVLLKRLADARRDGDPIRGIIRGIGQASMAMGTQAEGIQTAFARCHAAAGVSPRDVVFVEATGMGTPEADQIESEQTAAVYASGSRPQPLLLGTVLAQIGHTGAASGMAALIKTTLSMGHAESACQHRFSVTLRGGAIAETSGAAGGSQNEADRLRGPTGAASPG